MSIINIGNLFGLEICLLKLKKHSSDWIIVHFLYLHRGSKRMKNIQNSVPNKILIFVCKIHVCHKPHRL